MQGQIVRGEDGDARSRGYMKPFRNLLHCIHQAYNAEDFSHWAMSVGPITEKVVRPLPELRDGPGAGLQSLRQPDKAGGAENACRRTLAYSTTPSIRNIGSLLKNGQDGL